MARGRPRRDITGQRFGRLVVQRLETRGGETWAVCLCDCGASKELLAWRLGARDRSEGGRLRVASCGCLAREADAARGPASVYTREVMEAALAEHGGAAKIARAWGAPLATIYDALRRYALIPERRARKARTEPTRRRVSDAAFRAALAAHPTQSAAAEALGVTKQAVSDRVKRLEKRAVAEK